MEIQYIPVSRVEFTNDEGDSRYVYRPLSAMDLPLLEKTAAEGQRGSLLELGERYYFGIGGVPKNYLKALHYLMQASEQSVQDAEYLVAECYRCGYGIQKDYGKYFDWIFRAAEHGSWMAMFNVAAAYTEGKKIYDGNGVDIDYAKALEWSLNAEESIRAYWTFYSSPACVDMTEIKSRLMKAYYRICAQLAKHYEGGLGTERDTSRAFYWLNCAKQFVSAATGLREIPLIDDEIAKLKERMDREKVR